MSLIYSRHEAPQHLEAVLHHDDLSPRGSGLGVRRSVAGRTSELDAVGWSGVGLKKLNVERSVETLQRSIRRSASGACCVWRSRKTAYAQSSSAVAA